MSTPCWLPASLLLLAVTGAACGSPEPAVVPAATTQASVPAEVLSDQDSQKQAAYLDAIKANGGGVGAVPPRTLIALGQGICNLTADGSTDAQVTAMVLSEGYSKGEAATLIKSARQTLCPSIS